LRQRPGLRLGGGAIDQAERNSVDALTFPTDRKAKRSLSAAEDFIKEESWGEAARILQSLMDIKEDVFIETPGPNNTIKRSSLRGDADRLIGSLPPKGREFYELQYGARAKARLAEGKSKNDRAIVAEVAEHCFHTEAGAEAMDLLGTYFLDRGQYQEAFACFNRLLRHEHADRLKAMTLFKAALAFQHAHEKSAAQEVWKRLTAMAPDGMRIGDRNVSLEELRRLLDEPPSEQAQRPPDWPLFRGDPSRSDQGTGSSPFLDVLWTQSTVRQAQTEQWIRAAVKQLEEHQQPIVPGYFPIAVRARTKTESLPLLIYRSHYGIHAVDLRNGKLFWESPSAGSFDKINEHPDQYAQLNQWTQTYVAQQPHLLLENSTVGTLATDGTRVFAVDDLVLPPHPSSPAMQQLAFNFGGQTTFGSLQEAVSHSRLQAHDVATGKFLWELGGTGPEKGEFAESYFLGPPLPLAGKLYVLVEKASELRLLCLEPRTGELAWSQALANVRDRLLLDVGRRMRGVNLAYGGGVLVCPTNAGAIVAIDLLSHSLLWEYSYREEPTTPEVGHPQRMPGGIWFNPFGSSLGGDAKASAPLIHDDRVLITPPDSDSIICLNLRTGQRLWKQSRNDDLYIGAVHKDAILMVGRSACHGISLQDGRQLWRIETGVPSGQGVACENVYYLPLRSAGQSQEPEVCSIDMARGTVLAHTKSRRKEVPGNLIFYEGDVLSQTPLAVTAYPQLRVRLAQIDEALQKDPNDPVGLTDRGELKLDKGDLAGAVRDLQTALAHQPPPDVLPRTRGKLFEALTLLFQSDFAASEPYLAQYKEMCKVMIPDDATADEKNRLREEEHRRRANFLGLVGTGRERQGRLSEAFEAYLEFAGLSASADYPQLVSVVDDATLRVRPDAWAAGRITALFARATSEQRELLEGKVNQRWKRLQTSSDVEQLRHFVAVLGSTQAGQEARLQLAQRLFDEPGSFLEAELQLLEAQRTASAEIAAPAVEMLGRHLAAKELLEDAVFFYRKLGQDFADIAVEKGKTGAEIWKEITAEKRFKPYVAPTAFAWPAKLVARDIPGGYPMQPSWYFDAEGDVLPYFEGTRVLVQNHNQLRLIDRNTNGERCSPQQLAGAGNFNNPYQVQNGDSRMPYRTVGHLMVLSVAHTVYAFDAVGGKVVWDKNLLGGMMGYPLNPDRDGRLQIQYPDGSIQRLGQTAPVGPSFVCLHTRDGLVALDPVRGNVLWTRSDVPLRAQVFGDEDYVYWIEMRDGGSGAGHAVRARDGANVEVADFGRDYRQRASVIRGRILVSEEGPEGELSLRLRDVHTGKNVWQRDFSPHAILMHSDEPELVGIVEPQKKGKVTVIDLRSQQELLVVHVETPADLDKIQKIHLLRDRDRYYVLFDLVGNAPGNPLGGTQPNVQNGLRWLLVNGPVYAFARETGKLVWMKEVKNQTVILTDFKELPIMIFTARYSRPMGVGGVPRGIHAVADTKTIDKRTGKLLYPPPDKEEDTNTQYFYSITSNRQAGTVELTSFNLQIRHAPEKDHEP
jgi:outer membrane protein assembly factor BamB